MRIVCGTDFSARSRPAAQAAVALASRARAEELWLVHVLESSLGLFEELTVRALREAAERRMADELAALQKGATVSIRSAVLAGLEAGGAGSAAEALMQFARTRRADLLVVASQGHGGSPLYRVGGTSERIAQLAELPVLVVRDASAFDAWARGERPLRILLAVDWTRSCEAAIRWVEPLRTAGPCDVIAGYVYFSGVTGDASRRYGLSRCYSMVERDPEVERLIARDLAARVGDLGGEGEVTFRAKHGLGRLGDHLIELAEEERADVIVLGTHHKRGLARLASVASVTLRYSHSAVAVVPVGEAEILAPDEVPCVRRVLVPTDLSPLSNNAVPFGYTLLGERGGEVYLLHVLPDGGDEARDREVVAQLRALVPRRGVAENMTTRTEVVRHPNVARAIREAAERLAADVICIGSHGRSGFKRTVVGSVAEAVMRESSRPVLVVRPRPP